MCGWVALPLVLATVVTGCGPAIQTGFDDAQLTMRVRTALVNDPELGTEGIDVDVRGGVVELTGRVSSADLVQRAAEVVRGVDGVRSVTTTLDVAPPEVTGRDRPGRLPSIAGPATDEPLRIIAVGAAATVGLTPDSAVDTGVGVGPVIRLRPRNGWGPSLGFGWTRTPLRMMPDGAAPLATLVVRPVMGGVEWGVSRGRFASSISLVGGYAFNSLSVDTMRTGPGRAIAVDNSLTARAGVGVWVDVTPRVGLNLFGGYRVARPNVTFASDTDVAKQSIDADAVVVSVGFAYWLF